MLRSWALRILMKTHLKREMDKFIPYMVDKIANHYSKMYQKGMRRIEKLADKSIMRNPSKRKGRTYYRKRHYELMDDLQAYWDYKLKGKDMPIDPFTKQPYYRKSYFEDLQLKYGLSFKSIEAFERKHNPKDRIKKKS